MKGGMPYSQAQLADPLEPRRVGREPTIVTSRRVSWGLRRLHPKLGGLDVNLKHPIEDRRWQ
jgi:hypothetical protein